MNMKKILFALIIINLYSFSVKAQNEKMKSSNPLVLSFGVDFGKPLGANSSLSSFVIGGDLQVRYGVSENFSVTASAGIDARLNKGGVVNTIYYAPMLGGLRYYFIPSIYISEQAGYSLGLTKNLKGAFTNVAGLGFKLSKSSDILLAYKGVYNTGGATNFNTFALRVAYVFGK